MALRDPIGVWFSELENNWEERDFHHESSSREKSYRYCGDLKDGLCYGTVFFSASDPWPPAVCITITDKDGNSLRNSAVSEDYDRWLYEWPQAVVSSPSGKSIMCLINGRIYGWKQDKEGFVSDDGSFLDERLEGLKVLDARMHNNGILQLKLQDDQTMGYLCDADVILYPWVNGWIADKDESWKIADACKEGLLDSCPESVTVVIKEDDRWGEYEGCGVHNAYIEPGTEKIEGCILADNPDLKTMTIPDSVEYIEWGAFLNCRNLNKLVIEGDLSRVTNWDKGAFEGCPCEDYYLSLHNSDLRSDSQRKIHITTDCDDELVSRIGKIWTDFYKEDPEKRNKLTDHCFEFIIDDIGSGWEYVRIVLDKDTERKYRVSYIGPTVKAFVRTMMTLGATQLEEFTWLDEPSYIQYPWIVSRQSDVIYIEAPEIEEGFFLNYEYFKAQIRKGFEEMYRWEIVGID